MRIAIYCVEPDINHQTMVMYQYRAISYAIYTLKNAANGQQLALSYVNDIRPKMVNRIKKEKNK